MLRDFISSISVNKLFLPIIKIFDKQTWTLSRVGFLLAAMYFVIPLCSLPPLRSGYYAQVESGVFSFWCLSAVSLLWMHHLSNTKPGILLHTTRLPLVWGPLLLSLITIVLSIFHPLPLRDFIGSGQIAEGALTLLACSVLGCHFSIITRIGIYRKILFSIAVCVGLLICILTIIGSWDSPFVSWRLWTWAPFFFPDFLAFIDIALITSYIALRKQLRGFSFLNDFFAFGLFLVIAYYANNKCLTYGVLIAILATTFIWLFPKLWRYMLLKLSFFSLTIFMTLFIVFYNDFSNMLPESLKALGHLSTITSRTWLSKVTLVDLWLTPINEAWLQQAAIGQGWGTFSNISAANMFLIDQVSLFTGKEYQPSWEIITRDLMHTHNIITTLFHSIGLVGVGVYLYVQNKLINSLSRNYFYLGATFLIAYQLQLLFWFQFLMTLPFTLFALALLFQGASPSAWFPVLKPKMLLLCSCILFVFSGIQGYIMIGYKKGLMQYEVQSNTTLIDKYIAVPYVRLESYFGGQRLVGLARAYSIALQREMEKSPQMLVAYSQKLVEYLNSLPKGGNYLANNVALNILSELASKPENLKYFTKEMYLIWERLANDHVTYMPFRSDILLPFFNLYQTLGKEKIVMSLTHTILEQYPGDPIALWFTGSSQLKNPQDFDCGMFLLQKSIKLGVERLMPVPPLLKTKIMSYASNCHQRL